jgi:hypothetical protein
MMKKIDLKSILGAQDVDIGWLEDFRVTANSEPIAEADFNTYLEILGYLFV